MYQLHVMLSDRDYNHFARQVKASGLSRSSFIRALIMGVDIRPRPPDQYAALLRELSAIGNNLNQIARVANTEKYISPEAVEEIQRMQAVVWKTVKGL